MTCHIARIATSAAVGLALLAWTGGAIAKVKVIESDVESIAVGSEWEDERKLSVPPGKSIRILVLPSNVTKVLSGPAVNGGRPPWGGALGGTRGAKDDE